MKNPEGNCARCAKALPFLSANTVAVEGIEGQEGLARFKLSRELPPRGSIRFALHFAGPTLEYAHQIVSDLCPACSFAFIQFMTGDKS